MARPIFQRSLLSQLFLVIGFNLLPLLGVLFLDWRSLDLIYLYAVENFFILIFSCLKFRMNAFNYVYAYFYAAFCAAQMYFFLTLLGEMKMIDGYTRDLSLVDLNVLVIDQQNLYVGLAIILFIYLIDFIRTTKWFKKVAYKGSKKSSSDQDQSVFGDSILLSEHMKLFERLAMMQLTLIVGGALVLVYKTAFFVLVILVTLKLGLDIALRIHASTQPGLNKVVT